MDRLSKQREFIALMTQEGVPVDVAGVPPYANRVRSAQVRFADLSQKALDTGQGDDAGPPPTGRELVDASARTLGRLAATAIRRRAASVPLGIV